MRTPLRGSIAATMIATLMTTLCLGLAPSSQAADTQVPSPDVNERHKFDKYEEYNGTQGQRLDNEAWSLEIHHGNVNTLIGACNYTDTDSNNLETRTRRFVLKCPAYS